jgi:hypothetical protein
MPLGFGLENPMTAAPANIVIPGDRPPHFGRAIGFEPSTKLGSF